MFGLVNHYLDMLGLPQQHWLTQSPWSLVAVALATVWWTTGFNMVIFLAGLQEVPEDLYDAAKVDGAGVWSLFWNITLPCIRATLLFVSATTIIASFRVFGQIYVMTGGGPADASRTIGYHIYITGFQNFRMGSASAIAWVLFLLVAVFTLDPILAAARAGLRRHRSGDDSSRSRSDPNSESESTSIDLAGIFHGGRSCASRR